MAGTSVLKLKVDDKEYNASLKQAQQGMQHLEQALKGAGKSFTQVDKSVVDYVRGIGQMEAQSKTARGRISEMSSAFIELSLQYKNMSNEVKSSDVGKALAESMEQLKQRTIEAKKELEGLNREISTVKMPEMKGGGSLFSGIGDKMSGALQVFAGNMLTKAAGAVANLGSEIADMAKQGVELAKQGEGIRIAFERLGRGDILDGLREATHGTVTDLELMKAAVKFNDFKLPLDELGIMLQFAQQKAKDTGQSVDYLVESIVNGLGRKSLMILDNLGLSATEVKEKMKETGDMTKAVGEIIREQMSKAGDYVETAADRAAQANVSLQNKMEELGRKFAPVEEASSQLWTSMKIGILDVVGGPLTDFLNKLTEAGRLANQYGILGGNAKVGRMTNNLSNAREENRQSIYQQQQGQFWRYINRRENYMKERQRWIENPGDEKLRQHLLSEQKAFGTNNVGDIQDQINAAKKMLSEYQQAAKQILQPIKQEIVPTVIDTKGGSSNITSKTDVEALSGSIDAQTKKVQELQKAWRAAADDNSRKKIKEQIEQAQTVLDVINGKTDVKDVEIRVNSEDALKAVERIEGVKIEPKSFTVTADDNKAAEELKKLGAVQISDKTFSIAANDTDVLKNIKAIEGVTIADKSFTVTANDDKAADELKKLGAVQIGDKTFSISANDEDVLKNIKAIDGVTIADKSFTVTADDDKAADELKKLGAVQINDKTFSITANDTDVLKNIQAIDGVKIDPKSFKVTALTADALAALQKVNDVVIADKTFKIEPVVGQMPSVAMENPFERAQSGFQEIRQKVRLEIDKENLKADTYTLQTILKDAMQNGINTGGILDFQFTALSDEIAKGINVPDDVWQGILDQYNELREQIGKEPIKIDFKTGKIAKEGEKTEKSWQAAAQAVQTVGSAMSSIEDPAAKIAGTVAQAIANIALGYSQAMLKPKDPISWITFGAMGLAQMLTMISAVHSSTGYANGGIVKGSSYSGDNIPAMVGGPSGELVGLNAGEVVLNKAQQSNLASQLEGSGGGGRYIPSHVSGEQIWIALNAYTKRSGIGELVTWR